MESEEQLLRRHFDAYAPAWHERMRHHVYAMRYRAVERMVVRHQPASVIDVGCGTGDYCQLFAPDKVRYLGVDISEKMIAECRRLFPAYDFRVTTSGLTDVAPQSFDLVLDIGVLEYLEQPLKHLKTLTNLLKPGGALIVAVPNGDNGSRRFDRPVRMFLDAPPIAAVRRLLHRGQRAPGGYVKDQRVQNRPMTVEQLRAAGSSVGLVLEEWSYVSLYILSELIPGVAWINAVASRALSGRPGFSRLTRPTALVLVARLRKPAADGRDA
jgi:2-polyprenyl-3-methyl-5-hydroxy-6-metoxy-1,4-benzoquinol methylase